MASRVSAIIDWEALPLFPKVLELSQAFCRPSRTFTLMDFVGPQVKRGTLEETEFDDRMAIICDPQTSGGLLIALAADKAEPFEAAFERIAGTKPYRIGHITDDPSCSIAFADA